MTQQTQDLERMETIETIVARLVLEGGVAGVSMRKIADGARMSLGLIPDKGELDDERIWLAWEDLSRSDPVLATVMARYADEEEAMIRRMLPPESPVGAVRALAAGLRAAMCTGGPDALTAEAARESMVQALGSAPWASRSLRAS